MIGGARQPWPQEPPGEQCLRRNESWSKHTLLAVLVAPGASAADGRCDLSYAGCKPKPRCCPESTWGCVRRQMLQNNAYCEAKAGTRATKDVTSASWPLIQP